jgi:hypothetical protein
MLSVGKALGALGMATVMLLTSGVTQQASATQAPRDELCYQKFTGYNSAAFAMWFRMKSKRGASTDWTADPAYPVGQQRTIDVGEYEFAEGTYFQFEGSAALGSRFHSKYYKFCRNGQTKSMTARGTTLNNWWSDD